MAYEYRRVFVGNDPLWAHRKFKYVDEHRVIMARKLGRPLGRYELVHHKNENTLDNLEDNLELMPLGIHSRLHNKGREQSAAERHARSVALTGRIFTATHLQRMRESQLGKILSIETRKKMSEAQKGTVRSEETRQKMRASWTPKRRQAQSQRLTLRSRAMNEKRNQG